MNEISKRLVFRNLSLHVDYLSFKIDGEVSDQRLSKFGKYLSEIGFNSTHREGYNGEVKNLSYLPTNKHKVDIKTFIKGKSDRFWSGMKIDFSSSHAQVFYDYIRGLDDSEWLSFFEFQFFDDFKRALTLSRIDICYDRDKDVEDTDTSDESLRMFFQKCSERLADVGDGIHHKIDGNKLVIGKRDTGTVFRIYKKKSTGCLRFELELKHETLDKWTNEFRNVDLEELDTLESNIVKHFYGNLLKYLSLTSRFTDWLIHRYRAERSHQISSYQKLLVPYLDSSNIVVDSNELRILVDLFQLVSYLRTIHPCNSLDYYDKKNKDDLIIYKFEFKLLDYASYLGLPKTHYQREKLKSCLYSLIDVQFQTLEGYFDDYTFSTSAAIPQLRLLKRGRLWEVHLFINKAVYDYDYPFSFHSFNLTWENQARFNLQSELIKCISVQTFKKKFPVQECLARYDSFSNSRKSKIKDLLLELISNEILNKNIQPDFKILKKTMTIDEVKVSIDNFDRKMLNRTREITFYEWVNLKVFKPPRTKPSRFARFYSKKNSGD